MRMEVEEGNTAEWLIQKYTEIMDIYVFDVMINSETAFSEIIEDISQDTILCASTKQVGDCDNPKTLNLDSYFVRSTT